MIKTLSKFALIFIFSLFLISWGNLGHKNINLKSASSLPTSMVGFHVWADSLSLNGSNADYRKSDDPNEGPKHYIDLDYYPEFNTNARIASTYDSIVSMHDVSFVIRNGTLPWATVIAYDSLKNAFKNRQWHKAMLFASDLGHYVADGHMPLHLTSNYDGRATGQTGIHSRYESNMVNNYINSIIDYPSGTVHTINNVNNYILNYIYVNQKYVDSVLIADRYASNWAGNTTSSQYYSGLWSKTKFTTTLFKNASNALAELIYSAWIQAGSPPFGSKVISSTLETNLKVNTSIYPNPSNGIVYIQANNISKIELLSMNGSKIITENIKNFIDLSDLPSGIYILNLLDSNGILKTEKVFLQK